MPLVMSYLASLMPHFSSKTISQAQMGSVRLLTRTLGDLVFSDRKRPVKRRDKIKLIAEVDLFLGFGLLNGFGDLLAFG